MRVLLAAHLGMCFGVRDALQCAHSVPDPSQVTIHGELVHNEEVQAGLRRRGFHLTPEEARASIPGTRDVMVTAHGISRREARRLEEAGCHLIDTTCPLVRRLHEAAQALSDEGRRVIVIGRRHHVEVRGVVEDLVDPIVVEHREDVRTWEAERLGVVAQTTVPPRDAVAMRARIRDMNPRADIRFVNTICGPTRMRQRAVEDLVTRAQALVVVGGRRSHNTLRLAELARAAGVPVQAVSSADELDADWCASFDVVGLTAGTSTPDETIQDVHQRLLAVASRVPARASA